GGAGRRLYERGSSYQAERGIEDLEERELAVRRPAVRSLYGVLQRDPRAGQLRRWLGAQRLAVRHHATERVCRCGRLLRRLHDTADVARVLSPLQCETHPARRNVAVRLPRRAVHTAALVVGGCDGL